MKNFLQKNLFFILLVIPFFKPDILGVLPGTEMLETAYDVWRLLSAAITAALYLCGLIRRKRLPSAAMLFLACYFFFIALSTVLHASNLWETANYILSILAFCMLLEVSLRVSPLVTMDMLFYPLTVLILANFGLLLLYPNGICSGGTYGYAYNLLGIDNLLPPILVPYIFLTALRSTMRTGRLDLAAYVMIGISSLTLLLVWSATGLMGLAVALIFLLFFYQRRWETLFNGVTGLLPGFGLFFSVVLFRLQDTFSFIIERVLHKGLSFTGRTEIWDVAIEKIMASPWLGYGYARSGKVYRLRKGKYYHAHNIFLEILMEGGFCSLLCYLGLMTVAAGQLLRHRKHSYACLLSGALMAVGVMTSMEPFLDGNSLLTYGLLILSYHVGTLISGKETEPIRSH